VCDVDAKELAVAYFGVAVLDRESLLHGVEQWVTAFDKCDL
jgi:hypothetical protein